MNFIKCAATIVFVIFFGFLINSKVYSQSVTFSVGVVDPSIEFLGYSSPNSFITFLEGNTVIGTTTSDLTGYYYKNFPAYSVGIHSISFYSTDINNVSTPSFTYEIVVLPTQITSVSFDFPPTINIINTNYSNQDILVSGFAKPNSNIIIQLDGSGIEQFQVTSNTQGEFSLLIPKLNLAEGNFSIYAYLSDSLDQSPGNSQNFEYVPPTASSSNGKPIINNSEDNGDIIEAIDTVIKREFSWKALGEILGIDELENMLGVNGQDSFIPMALLFFSWGFVLAFFCILGLIFFLNSSGKRKNKPKNL
jgi:hypothetical protein